MEWIGWAFAAVAAVLLTVFIFLYLHQKQQAQHQHKKDQKAQAKLQTEMSRMQKELYHERDIIGLIQEHMVEGILILDDSDKIQLANRTATALLSIEKENWDNKSIFILTDTFKTILIFHICVSSYCTTVTICIRIVWILNNACCYAINHSCHLLVTCFCIYYIKILFPIITFFSFTYI